MQTSLRRVCWLCCTVIVAGYALTILWAADDPPKNANQQPSLADRRFEVIQQRVMTAAIESKEEGFPAKLADKPIFRYHDPARDVLVAAVWKLGDEGRPKAMLAAELYRLKDGKPGLSCEYSSLTATPFTLASDDVRWSPDSTYYEFKDLPKSQAPEPTKGRRSIQLRELSKRFASHEIVEKERCELRLLPQPIDRYVPSAADRADGAIFFFTFGTNPEVVLIIESDDGLKWRYAAGRMTGAEVVEVTLDGMKVWEGAPLDHHYHSPFTGSISKIEIPGIAADGSEISE